MNKICIRCKVNEVTMMRLIKYYLNDVPVYHELCNACHKKKWEETKKETINASHSR